MSEKVTIEKGVPVPPCPSGYRQYPFDKLKVGESFVIENAHYSLAMVAGMANRRYAPKRFVSRLIADNKRRVWRTA